MGGHNIVQYDWIQVLSKFLPELPLQVDNFLDTLVVSRLLDYSIKGGHSIRAWGDRLGVKKVGTGIEQWDELTEEMILRCHSDTLICSLLIQKWKKYVEAVQWKPALQLEHRTAYICGMMTKDGFPFDVEGAKALEQEISDILTPIDEGLADAFPPKVVDLPPFVGRFKKDGTLWAKDEEWLVANGHNPVAYMGLPIPRHMLVPFNPGSPKQIVERLNEAGWKPTERTKGHTDALKDRNLPPEKKTYFEEFGWSVSEENLKTLPDSAPPAAKDLSKRIVLKSRIDDVKEWLALVEDGSVYGSFNPIGAWTQRLSHAKPNLANVPIAKRSPKDTEFESFVNDLNDRMRALWKPGKNMRLIGTDADGLQMRVFAHLVNDETLIDSLIKGDKANATDIHSLHQRKLGPAAKSRDVAKTFIYAWLLGAGINKVAQILECSVAEAKKAVEAFIESYPLLKHIKTHQIPADANRGFFEGLDGRYVMCSSEHLMLAGYLQNGEAIIMKGAAWDWQQKLREEKIPFFLRTWPHDEWQTAVPDDDDICKYVQQVQIEAIRNQAVKLNLNCPLDGTSSWGYNWQETH